MFQLPAELPIKFSPSTGRFHEVTSPNDQSLLTRVQYATAEDIARLLGTLPAAKKTVAALSKRDRARILSSVSRKVAEARESFAWLISSEGGKPLRDARVEVDRAVATLELCAEEVLRNHGETIPLDRAAAGKNHTAFTTRDPIGAVVAISAFNHPLNLLCHQVGCALAAGCPVVLKPAPATPLCAFKLEELFAAAGLPPGALTVVHAEVPEIETLISSDRVDYVSFIGSPQVGWSLRRKIAPGTRISLEHGGQAPAIVRADADIGAAVTALTKGSFYHSGQVCISTQRIFVEETVYRTFLEQFRASAEALVVGPATDEATDLGPLIRPREVQRIQAWIEEATRAGATLECGNRASGKIKQFLAPTILTNVPRDVTLMREEVFGPVVCVNPYADEAELLEYLNSNDYKFEAAVFTADLTRALEIAGALSTMTVVINNHTAFRVDHMPFGGHKLSGLGMGGVRYAIEDMTRLKQIIIKA